VSSAAATACGHDDRPALAPALLREAPMRRISETSIAAMRCARRTVLTAAVKALP
jgi:hypothetical protein